MASRSLADLLAAMTAPETKVKSGRFFLYGGYGTGKTHKMFEVLRDIVPKDRAILVFDTSGNWVVKDNIPGFEHEVRALSLGADNAIDEIYAVIEAIRAGTPGFADIGAVAFDELSTIYEDRLNFVWRERHDKIVAKMETGSPEPKEEYLHPARPDYHRALTDLRTVLQNLYAIPGLHVAITAHEVTEMDGTIVKSIRPEFSEKVANMIAKKVHVVARLTSESRTDVRTGQVVVSRMIQVLPVGVVAAKCRIAVTTPTFPAEHFGPVLRDWLDRGAPEETPDVDDIIHVLPA